MYGASNVKRNEGITNMWFLQGELKQGPCIQHAPESFLCWGFVPFVSASGFEPAFISATPASAEDSVSFQRWPDPAGSEGLEAPMTLPHVEAYRSSPCFLWLQDAEMPAMNEGWRCSILRKRGNSRLVKGNMRV